jgi:hypothetical protein
MTTIKASVFDICKDRLFSAEGANILFGYLATELNIRTIESDEVEIEVYFDKINLVSTSFIGRFHELMTSTKCSYKIKTFRLKNLKPEIKKQFLKTDSNNQN